MNSSIDPSITPSTSNSTDAAMVPFNRATFMATYIPHQQWSLPDSIIYYISKNPSTAKVYGKLIQCCKYFMIRNPPIVVKDLSLRQRIKLEVAFDGELVDWNAVPSKVWLTNKLNVFTMYHRTERNTLSVVLPKICQSKIKELNLQYQICSINDLKFLGSKCENFSIIDTVVMNEDGAIVAFEDVFQLFPNARNFSIQFGSKNSMMITPKTFQELIKIPHFLNLQNLKLYELPQSFNLDCFYAYMKKNKKKKYYLTFGGGISYGYRKRLQAIVDELLATKSRDFKIPYIGFRGLNDTDCGNMFDLYCQN